MNKFNLLFKFNGLRLMVALFFLPLSLSSQINTPTWGVDDTSNCTVKSIEFIMVHDYIQLFNNSGADQQMRWIRYTDPDWPIQWQAGFTDPDSFYVDVLTEDTAEFIMLDPIEFSNQLIINVDHNNHVDTSYLRFKVYPVTAPADSLWLNFCIIITMPDVSVSEFHKDLQLVYDANHQTIFCKGELNSELTISLFDLNGKLILQQKISDEFELISVSDFEPGIYFAKISGADFELTKKVALY
jgi:hypothetical protein